MLARVNECARIKVALVGLGKQGELLLNDLSTRPDVALVAVVDVDTAKAGRTVRSVTDAVLAEDLAVDGSLGAVAGADVALVTTSSRIVEVAPLIEQIATHGVNVITTAEELGYPWRQYPELSAQLDEFARRQRVSVVGAGVNPGFLMDVLPIVLSHPSRDVGSVVIRRTADMRPHRPDRLTRFGLGLTSEAFASADSGVIYGHVGFAQSIHCLDDAFRWGLDEVVEAAPTPAVVTSGPRRGSHFVVGSGTVAVVEHRAVGRRDGETIADLAMYLGFPDASDDVPQSDLLALASGGITRTVEVRPPWTPFGATPATVLNLLAATVVARAGLLTTADFAVRDLAARAPA